MKKTLVSVAILVLGGVGIFLGIVHHQHEATTTIITTSPTTQQVGEPSSPGNYVDIPAWGVRVPLPAKLEGGVTYGIRKNVNLAVGDAPPQYGDVAYFASKRLAAVSAQPNRCGLKAGAYDDLHQRADPDSYDGGPGISLIRLNNSPAPPGDWDVSAAGHWYRIEKGSAGACYQGSDGSQEAQFITDIQNALKGVKGDTVTLA
jgi:hypothetical protein